jgi:Tfp pilus assembly protein PilX
MSAVLAPSRLRRLRARTRERGGILFIVAITMAVLATLGIYALNTAARDMKMTGFARQATVVHYVSEYGVADAAAVFQQMATTYASGVDLATSSDNRLGDPNNQCPVLADVQPITALGPTTFQSLWCKKLNTQSMYGMFTKQHPSYAAADPNYGKIDLGIERDATFYAELADLARGPIKPGFETNGSSVPCCPIRVEITSQGATSPNASSTVGTTDCSDYTSARLRAYVSVTVCDRKACGST